MTQWDIFSEVISRDFQEFSRIRSFKADFVWVSWAKNEISKKSDDTVAGSENSAITTWGW